MTLTKKVENDKIELIDKFSVQVREKTSIEEDGIEISSSITNRTVFHPDSDWSEQSDARVKSICDLWTDQDKTDWQALKLENAS